MCLLTPELQNMMNINTMEVDVFTAVILFYSIILSIPSSNCHGSCQILLIFNKDILC